MEISDWSGPIVIPTPAPPGRLAPFSRHRRQTPSSDGPQNANILYWQAFHQSIMIALTLHPLPALPHCLVTSSTPQRFPQQAHPKTRPTIWMVYPYSITRGIIKYFTNARTPRRRGQPRVVDSLHQDADAGATASQTCGVLKKKSYIAVS